MKCPKCNSNRIEVRDCYNPKTKKQGTITWCEERNCDYVKTEEKK